MKEVLMDLPRIPQKQAHKQTAAQAQSTDNPAVARFLNVLSKNSQEILYEQPKAKKPGALFSAIRNIMQKQKAMQIESLEEPKELRYGDVISIRFDAEDINGLINLNAIYSENRLMTKIVYKKPPDLKAAETNMLFRIIPEVKVSSQETVRSKTYPMSPEEAGILQASVTNEYYENLIVYKKLIGQVVTYKSRIQIVHEATKWFLTVKRKPEEVIL